MRISGRLLFLTAFSVSTLNLLIGCSDGFQSSQSFENMDGSLGISTSAIIPNGDISLASLSVGGNPINPGKSESISASLVSTLNLSSVKVSVALYDANNSMIASQAQTGLTFLANQPQNLQFSFALSTSLSAGTYHVGVAATNHNGRTVYLNNPNAASFNVDSIVNPTPSPTPTPAPTATPVPTATPAPTATPSQVLVNSDAYLNTGYNASMSAAPGQSGGSVQVVSNTGSGKVLWAMVPNGYSVNQGSGSIGVSYGSGAFTTNVNLTNINSAHVSAYPALILGSDVWGFHNGDQGPIFPAQLSSMSSLMIETSWNLNIVSSYAGNLDILLDLWLAPTSTYNGGQAGAVEVEILPYYKFVDPLWGSFVRTVSVPVMLNGVSTTLSFDEYRAQAAGSGGGYGPGTDILFYPSAGSVGLLSANVTFDAMILLNEAASASGVGTSWYLPGFDIGTEFGATNAISYSFVVNKLKITQSLK